ncbi:twin-arginine translocation signal domain-containing protein [Halorussus pelagicus]|uniref:twin-arginine translocation signal domain-containing protein n=1 Tax=Halorussus pelagicus TaxID=2505977 RepID=UPI00140DD5E7|nr:twin-arginine translocation signal domain-containing protein [Halorussus pelagicus]
MSDNDASRKNLNRRDFIKASAAASVAGGTLSTSAAAQTAIAWNHPEHDDYNVDRFEGHLTSYTNVYQADSLNSYEHWFIPVEVESDVTSHFKDYNGNWQWVREIRSSYFKCEWPSNKYSDLNEVDAEKDSSHYGGYDVDHEKDYTYWNLAEDTTKDGLDYLAGLVPLAGDVYGAGKVLDNFGTNLSKVGDNTGEWRVDYDWVNPNELSETHYWDKVDVQLKPDDSITIDIEDHVAAHTELVNDYSIEITAPESSPNAISKMTTAERKERGINVYRASEVKKTPGKFGFSPHRLEGVRPDEKIYTAPIEVTLLDE